MTVQQITKAINDAHQRGDFSSYLALHCLLPGKVQVRTRPHASEVSALPAPVAGTLLASTQADSGLVSSR